MILSKVTNAMFRAILFSLLVFAGSTVAHGRQAGNATPVDGRATLLQLRERIAALKTVSFCQELELNYASEAYLQKLAWRASMNFAEEVNRSPRFQIEDEAVRCVHNGREYFSIDKKAKTIEVESQNVEGAIPARYLLNSWYSLKHAIPLILADESFAFEMELHPEQDSCEYVLHLKSQERVIAPNGQLEPLKHLKPVVYTIRVQRASGLPFEITKMLENGDFVKASFTDINTKPQEAPASSWMYSEDLKQGLRIVEKTLVKNTLVQVGTMAPEFEIDLFGKEPRKVSLKDLRGKSILLQFFICHCGGCIEGAGTMNQLLKEGQSKDSLQVIAVNPHDNEKSLEAFCRNQKVLYPIAYNAGQMCADFGVQSYPTAVLIGPEGRVVYSGGLDMDAIRQADPGAIMADESTAEDETVELHLSHGTEDEDLNYVLRFEDVYMDKVEFRGDALVAAQYQILVKEFKKGKLVGTEMLLDGTEAEIFRLKENNLSFRLLCKTQDDQLRLQISTPRFSSNKLSLDLMPSDHDYALKDFVGDRPFETVPIRKAFYLYAIIPPTLHADGSGSYCEVAQSEVNPEEFGSRFNLPHYFLVEMKFVTDKGDR